MTQRTYTNVTHDMIGKPVEVGVYETDTNETWVETAVGVLVLHSKAQGEGGLFLFEGMHQGLDYRKDQTFMITYNTEDK